MSAEYPLSTRRLIDKWQTLFLLDSKKLNIFALSEIEELLQIIVYEIIFEIDGKTFQWLIIISTH